MSILTALTISIVFLLLAGAAKISLFFAPIERLVFQNMPLAKNISTIFFIVWAVFVGYYVCLGVFVRLYVRALRFKDWGTFKNLRALPPATLFRRFIRRWKKDERDYETRPINGNLGSEYGKLWSDFVGEQTFNGYPVLITGSNPWALRLKLLRFCAGVSKGKDFEITYVCCNVSPVNVWSFIKHEMESEKEVIKESLVFIDAYTNTFGFYDDVLMKRIQEMRKHEKVYIVSCNSAAGIHSGTAEAFKLLKKKAEKANRMRRRCVMIYDTLSVLAIPETDDEVSEFVIHVTAAELAYEMHTIFVEPDIDNRDSIVVDTIKACCGTAIKTLGEK